MKNIKLLASNLEIFIPNDSVYLTKKKKVCDLCDTVETHLKSRATGIWSSSHFKNNPTATTGPACHCKHFCFNRQDPNVVSPNKDFVCGHNHIGVCIECENINELPIAIDNLYNYVAHHVAEKNDCEDKIKQVFSSSTTINN